ncbi:MULTISPECIES: exosortase A [Sphingomonas]|uniref:Exosortase A n=1 Tax=Sphingomonas molluscorum TaxID=418184 RepID=A0ABU8Q713_9SPHN|nr:exosortase A [Sphingomonas sp. JUb134]MBM7406854.1 exosortase A [Sphingomonas sp. JUb134]
MSGTIASPPLTAGLASRWLTSLACLAGTWAALLLIFRRDVAHMLGIWWNSTTYGHCLFVPPILAWLVWQRRRELAQLHPQAWGPGLLAVAVGAFVWLVGDAAAVALFRHAGLVTMLAGAVVALLGPNVARGLAFPLGYMAFLVPFGDFLEMPLQALTVRQTMGLLHLLNVPAVVDGVLITIPNGYFEVAEACSGTKFVIAMAAYGVLVANVCYVRWQRRAAFLAMALIVPVLANGVRAAGTIYAAHLTSVEAATGFDHIVYGWVFFALVMAAVMAIGWHWFDRDPDAPRFDPAALQAPVTWTLRLPLATALVLAIALLFAGWGWAGEGRAAPLPARSALPAVPGWRQVAADDAPAWAPNYPGADRLLLGHYADAQGRRVDLAVAIYAGQHEGKELVGFGQGAIRENDRWVRIEDLPPLAGSSGVRMTAPGPVERQTFTWYRLGDVTTGSARRVKLETLKVKLLGGSPLAVAVLVSAHGGGPAARAVAEDFLAAAGPIDRLVASVAGSAR